MIGDGSHWTTFRSYAWMNELQQCLGPRSLGVLGPRSLGVLCFCAIIRRRPATKRSWSPCGPCDLAAGSSPTSRSSRSARWMAPRRPRSSPSARAQWRHRGAPDRSQVHYLVSGVPPGRCLERGEVPGGPGPRPCAQVQPPLSDRRHRAGPRNPAVAGASLCLGHPCWPCRLADAALPSGGLIRDDGVSAKPAWRNTRRPGKSPPRWALGLSITASPSHTAALHNEVSC